MMTPFPAARPSAFNTYGAFILARKATASFTCSPSNAPYVAVGMLWRFMNSLAKDLLPSSWAPAARGPTTTNSGCFPQSCKWSTNPFTRGASGPTTTRPMLCFLTARLTALWLFTSTLRLVANSAVPALPGATNNWVRKEL